jgi:hypothetical protein
MGERQERALSVDERRALGGEAMAGRRQVLRRKAWLRSTGEPSGALPPPECRCPKCQAQAVRIEPEHAGGRPVWICSGCGHRDDRPRTGG